MDNLAIPFTISAQGEASALTEETSACQTGDFLDQDKCILKELRDVSLKLVKKCFNIRNMRWLARIVLAFLAALLIASILCRNLDGPEKRNLLCRLCGRYTRLGGFYSFCKSAISAAALLEITKAVGIGSILIGWLYNVLQHTDGGFDYSELLEVLFPNYNFLVIIHFAALLCSMWQSHIGSREGAVLSLLIIVTDSVLLWTSLCHLVFFPRKRRVLVRTKWEREIKDAFHPEAKDGKKPGAAVKHRVSEETAAETKIYRLINMLSDASVDNTYLLSCLAKVLCYFSDISVGEAADTHRNLLIRLTGCWEHLFRNKSAGDRNYLLRELFSCINKELQTEEFRSNKGLQDRVDRAVGQSYALWLFQDYLEKLPSREESRWVDLFMRMHNDLSNAIESYLCATEPKKVSYIGASYLMLKNITSYSHFDTMLSNPSLEDMPIDPSVLAWGHASWDALTQIAFPRLEDQKNITAFARRQLIEKAKADEERKKP